MPCFFSQGCVWLRPRLPNPHLTVPGFEPFDGTWRIDPAKSKFDQKPFTIYTSQGWYHCVSCNPTYDVKADGTDQPVTGQSYDTVSVAEVDPKTISVTTKKAGKVVYEQTRAVSADGKAALVYCFLAYGNDPKATAASIRASRP